jgi:peptide/nickel transport system permease protein
LASVGELEAIEYAPARRLTAAFGAFLRGLWTFTRRKPLGAFGGLLCVIMIVMGIFAGPLWVLPGIAPHFYDQQVLAERLQGVSLAHPLGTDHLGRDILSRIIYGARTSVVIGFGAIAIAAVISTAVGVISGYYGGKIDTFLQRLVDIAMAFPGLILLIFLISVFGQGKEQITIGLGVLIAPGASRVIRSAVISIKSNQYFEAAKVLGANDLRILATYVLPNVFAIIIVGASIQIGMVILMEASLSFLGFGVNPPTPTWGRMLSMEGREYMVSSPGLAIWPGLAIAAAVFGFNMFGDALRDVLDPRLRGGRR